MKVQRSRVTAFIGLVGLLAGSIHPYAQGQEKNKQKTKSDDGVSIEKSISIEHSSSSSSGANDNPNSTAEHIATFKFLEAKYSFDKVVKGAPYSAVAVTETIQTLSDGNQIARKTEATLYRDSEGRTRREQTLEGVKTWPAAGEPPRMIFINDPIAGYSVVLDPRTRTARKTRGTTNNKLGGPVYIEKLDTQLEKRDAQIAKRDAEIDKRDAQITKRDAELKKRDLALEKVPADPGPPHKATQPRLGDNKPEIKFKTTKPEPVATGKSVGERKTESLGKQITEGVEAEGTRSTLTIPAGEIGNRLPLEIVDERWLSPELQTLVMSKHHDPRSGDTIYRLTNINRAEPNRSLFEIPPDYTLNDLTKPSPAELRLKRREDEL